METLLPGRALRVTIDASGAVDMRSALHMLDIGTRAIAYTLGGVAIALAGAVMATGMPLPDLASRTHEIVGSAFLALMGGLVLTAMLALNVAKEFLAETHPTRLGKPRTAGHCDYGWDSVASDKCGRNVRLTRVGAACCLWQLATWALPVVAPCAA